jgi:hypothetical protein
MAVNGIGIPLLPTPRDGTLARRDQNRAARRRMSVQIPPGSPPTMSLNNFECFRLNFYNLGDVNENRRRPKNDN